MQEPYKIVTLQKPPRWDRKQPREWGKGTIIVEGDFAKDAAITGFKVLAILLVSWVLVTCIFIIARG